MNNFLEQQNHFLKKENDELLKKISKLENYIKIKK